MPEPATEYTKEEQEVLGYSEPGEETPAAPAEAEPKKEPAPEVKTPEPSPEAPKEEPKKDETKPPPAAEPDAEKKFTQRDLEYHIKERLATRDRELEQLRNDMTRLRGELDTRRTETPRPEQVPIYKQDLATVLEDPAWRGWTLEKLVAWDEEHGTDHAKKVGVTIESRQIAQQTFARERERQAQQEIERKEVEKFKAFKAKQPEYFTEASDPTRAGDFLSTLTDKGRKLLDLMSTQEVYNWELAHKLLNFEAELENAKKQAVADYIKENSAGATPQRAKPTGSPAADTETVSRMSDEKLVDAYDRSKGERSKELRKELVRRGLLAPSED